MIQEQIQQSGGRSGRNVIPGFPFFHSFSGHPQTLSKSRLADAEIFSDGFHLRISICLSDFLKDTLIIIHK